MSETFGFLVIDKPQGLTSHDCVNRLRRIYGIKRIGHGGTLDPSATGVLPIAIGNATRLISYLQGSKIYLGEIQLGAITTTDDKEGEIISTKSWPIINQSSIEKVLDQFKGTIMQKPPIISSVHIKGERAYKRARRGEIFDLPLKEITINNIVLLKWSPNNGQISIKVECSSGTYIRSLARDIGEKLGCGGHLIKLRRTHALGFTESQAIELPCRKETISSNKKPLLLNPLMALKHLPSVRLNNESDLTSWRSGRELKRSTSLNHKKAKNNPSNEEKEKIESIVIIDNSGEIAGIAKLNEDLNYQPKIVFKAFG